MTNLKDALIDIYVVFRNLFLGQAQCIQCFKWYGAPSKVGMGGGYMYCSIDCRKRSLHFATTVKESK